MFSVNVSSDVALDLTSRKSLMKQWQQYVYNTPVKSPQYLWRIISN